MQLIGNEVDQSREKSKKTMKIIIVFIILLILIVGGLLTAMLYVKSTALKVYLDGQAITLPQEDMIVIKNGKQYLAIKDMAELVSYSYFKGEYNKLSEDATKCFIQSKDEVAMFSQGSNQVYKILAGKDELYNHYTMEDAVIMENGKLYATVDGIQKACNLNFTYDTQNNTISIFTLPYLVTYYNTKLAELGYVKLSDDFVNQKAILDGYLIASKGENAKYGAITIDGKEIMGAKYDRIEYIPTKEQFFVTNNTQKVGIINAEGKTKIECLYDNLTPLDQNSNLYIAKNNNKQGIIDAEGKTIIYLEYDQIGIVASRFPNNDITNPNILFDNAIPVRQADKWGMFDINGMLILPIEYDDIGCTISTVQGKAVSNVAILPKYECIVVKKDNLYGVVNSKGEMIVAPNLTSVYAEQSYGITEEYFEFNEQKLKVADVLASYAKKPQENQKPNEKIENQVVQNTTGANEITVNTQISNQIAQ